MSHSGLLILFSIFYADLLVLKKRNLEIFKEIFHFPPVILNLLVGLILMMILWSTDAFDAVSFLAVFGVMPIYLIRRWKFVQEMKQNSEGVVLDQRDEKLALLSTGLGVTVAWLLSSLVIEGVSDLIIPSEMASADFVKVLIASGASSLFLLWLIFKTSAKNSPQNYKAELGLIRPPKSFVKVHLIPALVGFGFACLSSWLVEVRHIQPDTPLGDLMSTIDSSWMLVVFLILAILIAPFIEELVFRGYFFFVLDAVKGRWFAMITVALAFAFLHVSQYWGDWLAIGMVTLLGFALTFLRVWAGTTWASITTHYVYNAAVTMIPVIMMMVGNPAYFKYQANFDQLDTAAKEELLVESIQKDPDLADAYNDLAWLYAEENKNLDQALDLINKALTFNPKSTDYLDTKAAILEKMDKTEEAKTIRLQLESLKTPQP